MNHQTIDLRNLALGAVIATAISVGAGLGTKPASTAPLRAEAFFWAGHGREAGWQAVRFCLGQALDIAGALTALAKQI